MAVSLRFESPIGTIVSNKFDPGQSVRITGKTTKWGISRPYLPVTVILKGDKWPTLKWETSSNTFGNYYIDMNMPLEIGTGLVRVIADWPVGDEVEQVNIGVGTEPPEEPTSDEEADQSKKGLWVLAAVGAFVLALGLFSDKKK